MRALFYVAEPMRSTATAAVTTSMPVEQMRVTREDHIGLGGDCCGEYLIVGRIADDGPPL